MKITSFQLTIRQGVDEQGYSDNFYISIDDKGLTSISRPYKSIPIEEQLAIEEVITSAIKAHLKLVKQVDNANKDLKLEEYRPIESAEEEKAVAAAKLSAAQELESAAPQSCALGDGEVSTGSFEDPKRPFGLSEEQIEVLKANKEEDELVVLKTALMSDELLKGEESKELKVIVGE